MFLVRMVQPWFGLVWLGFEIFLPILVWFGTQKPTQTMVGQPYMFLYRK